MPLNLLFLGTGTSAGVPMIGCTCPVCHSADPRDRRTRPSVLVGYPDQDSTWRQYLVDATPDLREQALRHELMRLDAVLYTHAHADHILGTDELRRFNAVMKAPLDVHAEPDALATLRDMFPYIFDPARNINQSFVATLIPHTLEPDQPLHLHGAQWTPLRLLHGRLPVLGFRIDWQGRSLAYCTDVSAIPPETYPLLHNLDILILDALRHRHHPTHLTLDQALDIVHHLQPAQTWFTHMAHDLSHAQTDAELPPNVNLAYDGLRLQLTPNPTAKSEIPNPKSEIRNPSPKH